MNIVYIAPQTFFGGASLSLLGMIRQLKDKHNIYVIVREDGNEYTATLRKMGVEVISYPYGHWMKVRNHGIRWLARKYRGKIECILHRRYAKELAGKLSDKNINVVHSNLSISDFGAHLAKELRVPHVWHIREFGKEDFELYPVFSQDYVNRVMKEESSKLIAISDGIYNKFVPYFGEKLVKISNGIDIEKFYKPQKEIFISKKTRMIMFSNISATKGQMEFVSAIAKLPQELKKDVEIFIAGSCYDEVFMDQLQNSIKDYNLQRQVEFLGFQKNIIPFLENTDIVVVASRAEAFGRVTVEGMLSGNLVIGANTGGTLELLGHGKYGVLYKQGNSESLSYEIEKVLKNKEQMREIASLGRTFAAENYSSEKNAREVEKVYYEVTKNKK